jgi:hypothetical protein
VHGDRIGIALGGIAEIFEGYPKPSTHPDENTVLSAQVSYDWLLSTEPLTGWVVTKNGILPCSRRKGALNSVLGRECNI